MPGATSDACQTEGPQAQDHNHILREFVHPPQNLDRACSQTPCIDHKAIQRLWRVRERPLTILQRLDGMSSVDVRERAMSRTLPYWGSKYVSTISWPQKRHLSLAIVYLSLSMNLYLPGKESSIRLAEIVWHNTDRVLERTSEWHVLWCGP
jgi:hypothetical protein